MAKHDDAPMLDTEQDEIDWADWLAQFKEEVFPLFEYQGLSFAEAVLVWKMNELSQRIKGLREEQF